MRHSSYQGPLYSVYLRALHTRIRIRNFPHLNKIGFLISYKKISCQKKKKTHFIHKWIRICQNEKGGFWIMIPNLWVQICIKFYGSGSVSNSTNPDPYQILRVRIRITCYVLGSVSNSTGKDPYHMLCVRIRIKFYRSGSVSHAMGQDPYQILRFRIRITCYGSGSVSNSTGQDPYHMLWVGIRIKFYGSGSVSHATGRALY